MIVPNRNTSRYAIDTKFEIYNYKIKEDKKEKQKCTIFSNISEKDMRYDTLKNSLNNNNQQYFIDYNQNKKCCLIEKKPLDIYPTNLKLQETGFDYIYTKLNDDQCNPELYRLDSNTQLLFDVNNNWTEDFCTKKNKELGSCRRINKECIDFVTKDFCDQYNMEWSNKTCNDFVLLKDNYMCNNNLPQRYIDSLF
jgi:hypothetical protein